MNFVWLIASLTSIALAQQQPAQEKTRDLKYEEDRAKAPSVAIPRGYALVIGIAKYKNLPARAQLDYAERDAESVYSVLINPEGGNFRAENVHRLIGAKATLANIRQEIEGWLPSVAKESDRVVIYFAGHGFINAGHGFLAPYDIDPQNISASGYSMDTLGSGRGDQNKSEVEGPADRFMPLRRHFARRGTRAGE